MKGDPKIIDVLNEVLTGELTAASATTGGTSVSAKRSVTNRSTR
jgi:hypothetical protein